MVMRRRQSVDHLFSDQSIHEYRREQETELKDEIKELSNDELQDSTDLLTLIFTSRYTPSPIQLNDYDLEQAGEVEKEIPRGQGLPGLNQRGRSTKTYQRIRVKLPFHGDRDLLQINPSSSKLNKPRYNELNRNEIVYYVDYTIGNKDAEQVQVEIQSEVDEWVDKVAWFVEQLEDDIAEMEEQLRRTARRSIEERREIVDTNHAVMAELGVDTGDTAEPGYVVPEKKREIELPSPAANSDDEVLQDRTFIEVLDLLDDLGRDLERSATPVRGLDEESLRDIFLMGINSHYSGFATGETFNRGGKTDILLRYDNENLFIAECKFWDGPSVYADAVHQLLNNLTVRDSHAALLIFSRRQDFGTVEDRIREATMDHKRYVSEVSEIADHGVYRLESESGHPVRVAVKAFDVRE